MFESCFKTHTPLPLEDIANGKLQEFKWGGPPLGFKQLRRLSVALQSPSSNLTKLELLSAKMNSKGIRELATSLQSANCNLSELCLSENHIRNDGLKKLSTALQSENCKLTILNIHSNEIGADGVKALSSALQHPNCRLTELDLSSNRIDSKGAEALSIALQNANCKLTELRLTDNDIASTGIIALADALRTSNCRLTCIQANESFDTEAAKALSLSLQSPNCKLTTLKFTSEGVEAFSTAMRVNCQLTTLNYPMRINKQADIVIKQALDQNWQIAAMPFPGPVYMRMRIDRDTLMNYHQPLLEKNLTSEESWKSHDISARLFAAGIQTDHVHQLIACYQAHLRDESIAIEASQLNTPPSAPDSRGSVPVQPVSSPEKGNYSAKATAKPIRVPLNMSESNASFESTPAPQATENPPSYETSPPSPSLTEKNSKIFLVSLRPSRKHKRFLYSLRFNHRSDSNDYNVTTSGRLEGHEESSRSPPSMHLSLPMDKKYHIFASHAWGKGKKNHRHVGRLVKELERIGVKVWFDEVRLSGEIHRKISDGLNDSFLYLACINKDFLEKIERANKKAGTDWCNFEFTAAIDTHGRSRSICVICDDPLLDTNKWFGPVRAALSGLLYINYTDASKVISAAQQIKDSIIERMVDLEETVDLEEKVELHAMSLT